MSGADKCDDLLAAAAKAFTKSFAAVLQLKPDAAPAVWVDGRFSPPSCLSEAPSDAPADCMWHGQKEALLRALSSKRAFESAFVSGRISVSGDMSVMARLKMENAR